MGLTRRSCADKPIISLLDTLITSKTRIKLLLKFFINASTRGYLRNLAVEFQESTNAIRVELNRLEEAGILLSVPHGNKRLFQANRNHPLFEELTSIVRKYVGIDQIIEIIAVRLGNLEKVFLIGPIVRGVDDGIIQIVLVGKQLEREFLSKLAQRAELLIKKKISYICFDPDSFETFSKKRESDFFLIWDKNQ